MADAAGEPDGEISQFEWGWIGGKLDKDGSGGIEKGELTALVGPATPASCEANDVDVMWAALETYDTDHQNGLDPEEWMAIHKAADANGKGADQNDGDMSAEEWESCKKQDGSALMLADRPGGCPQIALFDLADADGVPDGEVSQTEWGTTTTEGLFKKLDANGGGDIDKDELIALVQQTTRTDGLDNGPSCEATDVDAMWTALLTYDTNRDGNIGIDEWTAIYTAADADGNGDGKMSAEEWENCPRKA